MRQRAIKRPREEAAAIISGDAGEPCTSPTSSSSLIDKAHHLTWKDRIDDLKQKQADEVAGLVASRENAVQQLEVAVSAADQRISRLRSKQMISLNFGGEVITVPRKTLLAIPDSYFHSLLDASAGFPVDVDENGAILVDRDIQSFRHILNHLRGYQKLPPATEEDVALLNSDIDYFGVPSLRKAMRLEQRQGAMCYNAGTGVNADGSRLRVSYAVGVLGSQFVVGGKHEVTVELCSAEYVGIGVVSDQMNTFDQEFHRTPYCMVYYMTGVFYSNCPNHRKEEGLFKFEAGHRVTVKLDMDDHTVEFLVNGRSEKIVSTGAAVRLRFAVVLKQESTVRLVSPNDATAASSLFVNATQLRNLTNDASVVNQPTEGGIPRRSISDATPSPSIALGRAPI